MGGSSPERALQELLRRGTSDRIGLDELSRRIHEQRRELLQRHNLDGTLQQVRELLDRAVLEERGQLARDVQMDDTDRAFAEMRLDGLPSSTAAAVSELQDYPWQSSQARADYEQIKDLLGREVLDQRFAGMKQALEGATDEDRVAVGEMLRDLNSLLGSTSAARTRRRTSTTSWPSTGTSSPKGLRTSTSSSTRWPSEPPQPSGCLPR